MNRKQRRAAKSQTTTAASLHRQGLALALAGNAAAAIEAFRHAAGLAPGDIDIASDLGAILESAGDHEAAIAMCNRALQLSPAHARVLYNRGLALKSLDRLDAAEASYRRSLTLRPGDADTHNNLGVVLTALRRPWDAEAAFAAVVGLRPDDAPARNNLGVSLAGQGRYAQAMAACRQAMTLAPDYLEAFTNLGSILFEQGLFEQALAQAERGLAIAPGSAIAHNNRGVVLQATGRLEEAETDFQAALAADPRFAEAHYNLATVRLQRGDFAAGWEEYEWRWRGGVDNLKPPTFTQPAWQGEDLTGKTILLYGEQGLGDILQFVRYATPIAALGARVLVQAPAPLAHLLSTVPGVSRVVTGDAPLPPFDVHLPLMSGPWRLGTTLATVPGHTPYLAADPSRTGRWRDRLAGLPGLKVGLVWSGDPRPHDPRANAVDRRRSVGLARLAPVLAVPGVSFVSLQKGKAEADMATLAADRRPFNPMGEVGDFADTAAIVANLDLVITVDTSVAHLAGALGKPVWILSRFDGCWRWLADRDDSPWYPSARLFRQRHPGDWAPVVDRVAQALAALVGAPGEDSAARPPLVDSPVAVAPPSRSLIAQKFARAAQEHKAGRLAQAEALYRDVLTQAPDHPPSLYNLGLLALGRSDNAEAARLIGAVLRRPSNDPRAYYNYGVALLGDGQPQAAEPVLRKAIDLDPAFAPAHNNLGIALVTQRKTLAATEAFRRALALSATDPLTHYNLATTLLLQGDYRDGWREFEWRWRGGAIGLENRAPDAPRWTGESLAGKTLLLWGEQGLGDQIQFARFAPLLAAQGASVLLSVHPSLTRLLGTVAGVAAVVPYPTPADRPIDLQSPTMSLPHLLGISVADVPATVPYVRVEPGRRAAWQARLSVLPGLKVGVVWAGEPCPGQPEAAAIDQRRSIPLAAMAGLLATPGVTWISLQKGAAAAQIADLPANLRPRDWMDAVEDFADTAALADALDLVITVDTSVAHLAGALGKPVWILSRFDGCWRWLENRDDSPWYPTARLFRQQSPGDWRPVLDNTARALSALVAHQGRPTDASRLAQARRLGHQAARQLSAGDPRQAEMACRASLALAPDNVAACSNLAAALFDQARYQEALVWAQTALTLDPGFVPAATGLALTLHRLHRRAEAGAAYRRAVALAPDFAELRHNHATWLLAEGHLVEGWREYEWRWRAGAGHLTPRPFPQPLWQGQPLAGQTLLLHAEQGLGDTIQFARFATALAERGGRIVLEVPRSLTALLATVPGVAQVVAAGDPLPPFDVHLPMMSAPDRLGVTLDNIPANVPYLQVEQGRRNHWAGRLAHLTAPRVGLVFAGNPRPDQPRIHLVDQRRSMAATALTPLLRQPGVRFVSLQMGETARQLDDLAPEIRPFDPMGEVGDFADTAALIEQLDLVIAVDTSVAHLAGALGKPVWILSRFDACWRWLEDRDDSPWYPTARLFRQTSPGDWDSVVARVATALADLFAPVSDQPAALLADGLAHHRAGRLAQAETAYRRALELSPGYAEALTNLGCLLRAQGRLDEAIDIHRDALRRRPDSAEVNNNLGVALKDANRLAEAVAAFRRAVQLDPGYGAAHSNLGVALLACGQFREGFAHYEWRWQAGLDTLVPRSLPVPEWTGDDLAGRTILLHAEQGLGDTLQFVRYAPLLARRGARVILEVQPPLTRLLQGLTGVAQVIAGGEPLPPVDAHLPLLSMPWRLGTMALTIPAETPYLRADADQVRRWRDRLDRHGRRSVGLVWAGASRSHDPACHAIDKRRSIAAATFLPVLEVPGITFVSLQKGPEAAQATDLPADRRPLDPMPDMADFADTAALVAALDLVITVDTAVAHLAGALGKPVWILSRFDGCWRWLTGRDDSPWYPTARLFRQERPGAWGPVIERVVSALSAWTDGQDTPAGAPRGQTGADDADRAPAIFARAIADHAAGRWIEAEEGYLRMLTEGPAGHAEAFANLGLLYRGQGQLDAASENLHNALARRPDLVDAHNSLGLTFADQGDWERACQSYRNALTLRPDHPQVLSNLGVALQDGRHLGQAERAYRRALAIAPALAGAHYNLGQLLLLQGEFPAGWREHEWLWRGGLPEARPRQIPGRRWSGESLAGKTILFYGEQGFGDVLQFVRFATPVALRGARVILEVQPALVALLSTVKGVAQVVAAGQPLPPFDVTLPMMGAPFLLETTLETIPADVPYLQAPADRVAHWRDRLAMLTGLKVGLVWAGAPRSTEPRATAVDRRRSIALAAMALLLSLPGVSFVSLQKGGAAGEVAGIDASLRPLVVMDGIEDFAETAAIVATLDLVITVDTAVAHLAGALGKPVWILSRFDGCWRWMEGRQDSPWYPTARLFRQRRPGDWAEVVVRVATALEDLVMPADRLFAEVVGHVTAGRRDLAVPLCRRILAGRSDHVGAAHQLGLAALDQGDAPAARRWFERTIALAPDDQEAHNNLGIALLRQGQDGAATAFRRALRLAPDDPAALSNLAATLSDDQRWADAAALCRRALCLAPGLADAWANLGVAASDAGDTGTALALFRRAVALAPDHVEAHYNLGTTLLSLGRYRDGWDQYEWRRRRPLPEGGQRDFAAPEWQGEDLAGRTILLHAEQGLGDALQFVRYAGLLAARGARVLVEAAPALTRLLATVPGVSRVVAIGEDAGPFDYHLSMMSAPHRVGTTALDIPAAIPYLAAPAEAIAAWRQRFAQRPGLKVGLVWAGAPRPFDRRANAIDRRRSLTLARLMPVLRVPGICFVSLQKGRPAAELDLLAPPLRPLDWMAEVADFADTAALVAALDLIISVDTAVAHLAAALGKPVWILSRFAGCWRWLGNAARSPWYPTARIFGQPGPGEWDGVIATVAAELAVAATAETTGGDAGATRDIRSPGLRAGMAAANTGGDAGAPRDISSAGLRAGMAEADTGGDAGAPRDISSAGLSAGMAEAETGGDAGAPRDIRSPGLRAGMAEAETGGDAGATRDIGSAGLRAGMAAANTGGDAGATRDIRSPGLRAGMAAAETGGDAGAPRHTGSPGLRAGMAEADTGGDAGATSGRPPLIEAAFRLQRQGDLNAASTLYRQVLAGAPNQFDSLLQLGLIALARGQAGEAVPWLGKALLADGSHLGAHLALGRALVGCGQTAKARAVLMMACQRHPASSQAWYLLGLACHEDDRFRDAAAAYRQALILAPGDGTVLTNLGSALGEMDRHNEAIAVCRHAAAAEPTSGRPLANLGASLHERHRIGEAIAVYRQALAQDDGIAAAHHNLATALLLSGQLAEGWQHYEWRWRGAVPGLHEPDAGVPRWRGEDLTGRTILLQGEQGFGDTLQFARFATVLAQRGARVVLDVYPALRRLLATVPGVARVLQDGDPSQADVQLPLLSLPNLLRTELDSIPATVPYVHADADAVADWRRRLADLPGLKVGIAWAGDPRARNARNHAVDRRRSLALAQLTPLLATPRVSFVSLQMGAAAAEIAEIAPPLRPFDAMAEMADFADTAAVVTALDLVIAVDTAVVHLAGALGRPVWILSRFNGCWRWLENRADSPWYPSARLFRQPGPGRWEEAIAEAATALAGLAPAIDADALFAVAVGHHQENRLDQADRLYRWILDARPGHPVVLHHRGVIAQQRRNPGAACALIRQSLAAHPSYCEAWVNLGTAERDLGRRDLAERSFVRAIALKPDLAEPYNNLGALLKEMGRLEEAIAAFRKAAELNPDHAEIHCNLGAALLEQGDYPAGWVEHEWRLHPAVSWAKPRPTAVPLWDGQSLAGRTLLLRSEQGLGDDIQFARFATPLAALGARVILEVQTPLVRLMASVPGVSKVVARDAPVDDADFQLSSMSVPHRLKVTLETLPGPMPYVSADPRLVRRWQAAVGDLPGLKVGLVWAGDPRPQDPRAHAIDGRRSMPLALLEPLFDIAGVSFVSLQMGEAAQQRDALPQPKRLRDPMGEVADFADTAALVANLDLVVSVDTAVVHLAGAMGKPVWVLSRFDGCWRWLTDRDDSPWYPGLRLFRQQEPGDWPAVVTRVARALRDLVGMPSAPPIAFSPHLFDDAVACHGAGRLAQADGLYRQVLADRPDHPGALHHLGMLARMRGEPGTALIRRAVQVAPDYPEALNNLAAALADDNVPNAAIACARRAIALRPDYAKALCNLGKAYKEQGQVDLAMACYRRALAVDPALVMAYANLAAASQEEGLLALSLTAAETALALEPTLASAHNNRGVSLQELGDIAGAARAFDRAVRLAPDYAEAHTNLGMAFLALGQTARGWAEYEWRWTGGFRFLRPRDFGKPRWKAEDPRGRTILLHAEQGLGDMLQFARFGQAVAALGATVILEMPPPLTRLLARVPGVARVVAQGEPLPPFDLHLPLMSVPAVLPALRLPQEPYLTADPVDADRWKAQLAGLPGLKVGLVWAGEPRPHARGSHLIDRRRSMTLARLSPLLAVPGISFVSLQKGAAAQQIEDVAEEMRPLDPMDAVGDFADTAAIVDNLDLVIAVDTSVVHLAGALGKPVWILSRFDACWRWMTGRDDSPWYPTARLFRQARRGDWDEVIGRVRQALEQLVRSETPAALFDRAIALHQRGQPDQAEALYARILALDPTLVPALYNLGNSLLAKGRHEAAATCYRRAIIAQPELPEPYNNLGSALSAQSRFDAAGQAFERAIRISPALAAAHNNLGNIRKEQDRPVDAAACFRQALALQPDYEEANYNLANLSLELGDIADARARFRRVLARRPDLAQACNNLGSVLYMQGETEAAVAWYRRALVLKPDFAEAHTNLGTVWRDRNALQPAIAAYRHAISLDPAYPLAHTNLAVALLLTGDFDEGLAEYEWRQRDRRNGPNRVYDRPLWNGQPLAGRTLLLHAEQGLGDCLQFARFAPLLALRGARVILEVYPQLTRLFASLPGVHAIIATGAPLPAYDYHLSLVSVAHRLGLRLDTIPADVPYLAADPGLAARWAARLAGSAHPRVGLVWAGAPRPLDARAHSVDRRRSLTFEQLAPLLDSPGVRFVSLQKDWTPPDAADPRLIDPMAEIVDFADTAAVIANLDLVISVDTSVAHLAGALGKPVWILSRFDGCWRWLLDREDSPWYPTARLFRQDRPGDWAPVIDKVDRALRAFTADARRRHSDRQPPVTEGAP